MRTAQLRAHLNYLDTGGVYSGWGEATRAEAVQKLFQAGLNFEDVEDETDFDEVCFACGKGGGEGGTLTLRIAT